LSWGGMIVVALVSSSSIVPLLPSEGGENSMTTSGDYCMTADTSAIDGRTTRHPGYAVSQQKRKRVEEIFGWLKTVGLRRKVKLRGVQRVGWLFTFAAAVYNLVRMRNLVETTT
ncbi:MAG: transposase, partial [Nitrospira sp.]|nr:transposase [Nitrospira sp.]